MLIQQLSPPAYLSTEAGDISLSAAQAAVAAGTAVQVVSVLFQQTYGAAGPSITGYSFSCGDIATIGNGLDEATAKTLLITVVVPYTQPITTPC